MTSETYYQKNREREIARSKRNNRATQARRRALLAQFPCLSCGNSNPDVIEWHHIDPETKDRNLFTGNISENTFWEEAMKCVPLCSNCHTLIHKNKLCLLKPKR